MGLAYNLDTTTNPYIGLGLSNYLVKYPEIQIKSYATEPFARLHHTRRRGFIF